jgi:tetratricopeptide (TPR) repeat protein
MKLKPTTNVLRWATAIFVGIWMVRWAESKMQAGGSPFEIVGGLGLYGLLLFVLFGIPIISHVANRFAGLYWPDDSDFRIVPEYSIAEARVKEGKYEEAIEEYRTVILQHPADVYPHLRIAELALDHLHDAKLAELELQSAVGKAAGGETAVLAAGRLADFYQQTQPDPKRALEVMKQLRRELEGTKHAKLVDERIATLERLAGGYRVPKPPAKIAVKQADEAEIRRRRGF